MCHDKESLYVPRGTAEPEREPEIDKGWLPIQSTREVRNHC